MTTWEDIQLTNYEFSLDDTIGVAALEQRKRARSSVRGSSCFHVEINSAATAPDEIYWVWTDDQCREHQTTFIQKRAAPNKSFWERVGLWASRIERKHKVRLTPKDITRAIDQGAFMADNLIFRSNLNPDRRPVRVLATEHYGIFLSPYGGFGPYTQVGKKES